MGLKFGSLLLALVAGCSGPAARQSPGEGEPGAGIGLLTIQGDRGIFGSFGRGTGVVIDGQFMITVAHNLRDEELGRVTEVEAGGGVNGKGRAWTVSSAYLMRQSEGGRKKSDPLLLENDFGFIELEESVTGGPVFNLDRMMAVAVAKGAVVHVAGYAGGKELLSSTGRVTGVRGSLFSYEAKTRKGMSGSPVWVERNGRRVLVGIHLGSDIGGFEGAVARRVDRGLIGEYDRWVASRAGRE